LGGQSRKLLHRPQDTALPEGNRSGVRCESGSYLDAATPLIACRSIFDSQGKTHLPHAENSGGLGAGPPISIIAAGTRKSDAARRAKKQLNHRFPPAFILRILNEFNSGKLDAPTAVNHLGISRARLYQLRTDYLKNKSAYQPNVSGGNRRHAWPPNVIRFLEGFLPLQSPPNYQLVADELERRCHFKRSRSTVASYIKKHLSILVPTAPPKKRTYRRFRRAHIGELWQHDSSIHQWWPAARKQTLLLTIDDCSGLYVAGRFVESDTTWNHFQHFREAFERHGLPDAIYTDGLSLFGPSSSNDHADSRSEFQRALRALSIAHLVVPTPQAKGKIERSFQTFQKRLVTLLAHAGVTDWKEADPILQMEINRQNRAIKRSTGKIPAEIWDEQLRKRTAHLAPTPPSTLLDLHLSLRDTRKVHTGPYIEFDGQSYEIAPTARKVVTVIYHPRQKLWITDHSPKLTWPPILGHFTLSSV
jgi:hypothetical protein